MQTNARMRTIILALALPCTFIPSALSQDAIPSSAVATNNASIPQPEYVGEFFALGSGNTLVPLERQKPGMRNQNHNYYVFSTGKSDWMVPEAQSTVTVPPGSRFVVKIPAAKADVDPSTYIVIVKFTVEKTARTIPVTKVTGTLLATHGSVAQQEEIPLHFTKYGTSSYIVTPASPLQPGQYGFGVNEMTAGAGNLYCFGVAAQ